jgi:transposase-like protein
MIKRETCPQCGSRQYKRNGRSHTGKHNHKGKVCGRAFVLVPENHLGTAAQRAVMERLVRKRISLRGICRVIGGGHRWLLDFRGNALRQRRSICRSSQHQAPQSAPAAAGSRGGRARSFVGRKANRPWRWMLWML